MCSKNASIMFVQLNLSTTATLGTEESGHCREVETRMNIWTVRPKNKMAVVERWPLVEVRMYFLSVWSTFSYTQTLYLSVFLFICLYYTRKVSIFFLIFFRLQVCQTKWRACSLLAHK